MTQAQGWWLVIEVGAIAVVNVLAFLGIGRKG